MSVYIFLISSLCTQLASYLQWPLQPFSATLPLHISLSLFLLNHSVSPPHLPHILCPLTPMKFWIKWQACISLVRSTWLLSAQPVIFLHKLNDLICLKLWCSTNFPAHGEGVCGFVSILFAHAACKRRRSFHALTTHSASPGSDTRRVHVTSLPPGNNLRLLCVCASGVWWFLNYITAPYIMSDDCKGWGWLACERMSINRPRYQHLRLCLWLCSDIRSPLQAPGYNWNWVL